MWIPKQNKLKENTKIIREEETHYLVDAQPWLVGNEDEIVECSSSYYLLKDNGYWFTDTEIEKI